MFSVIISLFISSSFSSCIVNGQSTPGMPQSHSFSATTPQVYEMMSKLSTCVSLEQTTENCPSIWQSSLGGRWNAILKIPAAQNLRNGFFPVLNVTKVKMHAEHILTGEDWHKGFYTRCCLIALSSTALILAPSLLFVTVGA